MKYYIIKPKSKDIDQNIIDGLNKMDKECQIVDSLYVCDIAILQKGWTRSIVCLSERDEQLNNRHKLCREAYLYTDGYKVTLD